MKDMFSRLGLAAVLAAAAWAAPRAEILEQIVVKVNGDIITKTEFEERQVTALRQKNQAFTGEQTEELKQAIAAMTPQLIVDAVDELLLLQRGRELGYKLSDQQFTQVVEQIRKENKLETEEAFQAALRQEGMSTADLRRSLEKQMIISQVQGKEVMQKVGITEDEARTYHAAHLNEFTTPASVTLREILIATPETPQGVSVGAEEETREKVEAIRERVLKGGESFDKLAAEISESPSKANGGSIGPLNMSELSQPLQDLLAKMKPGDVSEPLRTPKGYQLLKLETRTAEEVLPPERVRDKIADKLYDAKRREEMKKYLLRLRAQAIIEWKNEELRKAYESAATATPAPADPATPAAEPAAKPSAVPPSPSPPPSD